MKDQHYVRPGEVELMISHKPGAQLPCGCDYHPTNAEHTVVNLNCVSGYLINRVALPKGGES